MSTQIIPEIKVSSTDFEELTLRNKRTILYVGPQKFTDYDKVMVREITSDKRLYTGNNAVFRITFLENSSNSIIENDMLILSVSLIGVYLAS